MSYENPVATLAAALHHAELVALSPLTYDAEDHAAMVGWSVERRMEARADKTVPLKRVTRRPTIDECEVVAMFSQTWGSTAMGFGGIGGAAMTAAYTVIIRGPANDYAVYWHGRLGYRVDPRTSDKAQVAAFLADTARAATAGRREAVKLYGAVLPAA